MEAYCDLEAIAGSQRGEDAIYFAAAKNRYAGAVSPGFTPDGKRIRRKVSGKTKQEVRDKLKALHQELDAGLRSSTRYTVRRRPQVPRCKSGVARR